MDDPGHLAGLRADRPHLVGDDHPPTQILEQSRQRGDQGVGAALGEPDAAIALQRVDQGVDRRSREGAAAHQQGVERERLAQVIVLHVAAYLVVDAAPGLQPHQRRRRAQHVAELQEGHVAQLLVALVVDRLGELQKAAVALDVRWICRGDLTIELALVVDVVEMRAVRPEQAVEGRYRQQLDVVGALAPGEREQFVDAGRIGHHRRAGVEGEALIAPDVGAAARFVARLDQGGGEAGALQPDRQRQAAEAGPDHADLAAHAAAARSASSGASERTPSARPIGTGGLPVRIRTLSPSVALPA